MLKVQGSVGDADESVFLDPNTMSDDGTVAIRGYSFSEDDRYFAYGLSAKGSDWVTVKVTQLLMKYQHSLQNKAAVCVLILGS